MQRRAAAKRGDTRWTRLRESLRTGLWFVPTLFVAAATVLSVITVITDQHLSSTKAWFFFDGGPTSAEQILATIAASMITVTGLVFTITIVVLQLASNQFSPRVLRTFLRDRGSQIPLGVFTATFVYSLFVLIRVRTGVVGEVFVPRLSVSVSFALIVASMLALVYFVNHRGPVDPGGEHHRVRGGGNSARDRRDVPAGHARLGPGGRSAGVGHTAVQVIDRLEDLLGRVARRPQPSGLFHTPADVRRPTSDEGQPGSDCRVLIWSTTASEARRSRIAGSGGPAAGGR